ncbi:[acyl-carrier-protein] S-malonyltransferase [candidate division KSB1 bacterium 4484_188]|nr:MAG: [acyl-carrier-protein] S-malonyltransferase [candidate division KSB1 bacterium 4484_188]
MKAFLFPGQGAQYVGMAKDLYDQYPAVRSMFDRAEEILGFPLRKIAFEGPEDELKQTQYTQPAIFVHSLGMLRLLNERELKPEAVAGHSLGEYSALVCAGALNFEVALRLVKLRGRLMQYSGEQNPGTMAAIIGLPRETVEEICRTVSKEHLVQPANFNSPGQIVISGSVDGVHRAMALAKENKARAVMELVVSGAFHSPLMEEALSGLKEALAEADIRNPEIPVYTNVTAQPVQTAETVREMLQRQLLSPVLWQNIIENMHADGFDQFYEVGPSKVLCGLNRRINRQLQCTPLGKAEDLENLNRET